MTFLPGPGALALALWALLPAFLSLAPAAVALVVPHPSPSALPPSWSSLKAELILMARTSQAMRQAAEAEPQRRAAWSPRIQALDWKHTVRLKQMLAQVGWPSRSAVGVEGAQAVFILVQRSPDRGFQAKVLPLLEASAKAGEAELQSWARLLDELRLNQGLAQRFGTQYRVDGDRLVLRACEDLEGLEVRRASVGLAPRPAYEAWLRQRQGLPEADSLVEPAPSPGPESRPQGFISPLALPSIRPWSF